jgi:hypothetical protein
MIQAWASPGSGGAFLLLVAFLGMAAKRGEIGKKVSVPL